MIYRAFVRMSIFRPGPYATLVLSPVSHKFTLVVVLAATWPTVLFRDHSRRHRGISNVVFLTRSAISVLLV